MALHLNLSRSTEVWLLIEMCGVKVLVLVLLFVVGLFVRSLRFVFLFPRWFVVLKTIGIPIGILIVAQVLGSIGFTWNGFRAVGCDFQSIGKINRFRSAAVPVSPPSFVFVV